MPRARTIKYGFFVNDELAEIDFAGRLLFIGLWTLADREGKLEDKPRKIKGLLFLYEDVDVDRYLNELQAGGFLTRYEIEDKKYIKVLNFTGHQNPHKNEAESKIYEPAPTKHSTSTVQAPEKPPEDPSCYLLPVTSNLEEKEKQEKEKESLNKKRPKHGKLKTAALEILDFLNEKSGREYLPGDTNLNFIMMRLKESLKFKPLEEAITDCRMIIVKKCREWGGDEKMYLYLRPKTLFGKTNFSQYQGELVCKTA